MKYQSSVTKLIYNLDFPKPGRYPCPECAKNSKRKNPKDVQFYDNSNIAYCHKCETSLYPYKPYEKKTYKIPERKNSTKLTDEALKYWEGRMISQQTLNDLGVYSDNEYMPQFERIVKTICFPFYRDGELVNIKYRGPKKSFKLVSGAELIWYNFDVLKDYNNIIICEGEGEALTWHENGFKNVVSVPNGAGSNVDYLDSSIQLFDSMKCVYLATDNDAKGIELRDELIRRIGAEKCKLINFKECKDGNEFFCKYGGVEFKDLYANAKPVPVKGVVHVEQFQADILDLREHGIVPGSGTGIEEMDKYCTWELGRLATVTGVPGSGKSELVDLIITRLNLLHGWRAAFFTPENYPLKYHYAKIHEKLSGVKFRKDNDDERFWSVYEYIKSNYYYILNEEDFTVDSVIDSAKALIKQYGVKIIVLDPYNRFEHDQNSKESETQYISKFLDKITMFAKMYNVLVFLVAHPRKMQKGDIPTLYDIAGSANFYNKTDYGLTVHRERDENNMMNNEIQIHWQKIKFKHLGEQGVSLMRYNYTNGRFEDRISIDQWDNSCWLTVDRAVPDPNEFIEPNTIFDGTTEEEIPY